MYEIGTWDLVLPLWDYLPILGAVTQWLHSQECAGNSEILRSLVGVQGSFTQDYAFLVSSSWFGNGSGDRKKFRRNAHLENNLWPGFLAKHLYLDNCFPVNTVMFLCASYESYLIFLTLCPDLESCPDLD